ncbi:MAG: hypothetical protein SYC29_17705, partial [Planctomycetota bacterium]|nr:hypothetical protein [Planctomycetota bacterium]
VDVNDRRVRQKIDAYCARFPFDDPEVIRIINAFVDAADEEGAAMPTAAAPTAPAAQDKGTVGDVQGLAPPESVREVIEELERRGRPPIPSGPPAVTSPAKRQSTRIVAPKVNTRIAPEQVAATPASPLWRTPDRTAPSLPDAMPLAIPSESPAARDISRQLENARRQSQQLPIAMTTPPVPGIIGSADWSTAAAHASTNDIDDDGAETQDAAGATPDERGEAGDHPSAASASPTPTAPTPPSPAATAVPPPPPPDISSITELTGLEALIGRTTLAADRIGLLAIVIGSATLLASLVLRGFRLTGTEQRCADS